jgi:transcriptional regulator with XRE-family HTH domain
MKIQLSTVEDAGTVIRAVRKAQGIRIDDFALVARVSKQFMTDLENGKPTVQMGRVLDLLDRLGLTVTVELPEAARAMWEVQTRKRRANAPEEPKPTEPGSA